MINYEFDKGELGMWKKEIDGKIKLRTDEEG